MLKILLPSNKMKKSYLNTIFRKNKKKICNICEAKHSVRIYGSGCESNDNEIEIEASRSLDSISYGKADEGKGSRKYEF